MSGGKAAVHICNLSAIVVGILLLMVHGKDDSTTNPLELEVLQEDTLTTGTLRLIEGATLNLTCRVTGAGSETGDLKLSWYNPNELASKQDRLIPGPSSSKPASMNLIISPVMQMDTGNYKCEAIHRGAQVEVEKVVRVVVEADRGDCNHGNYECTNGFCVPLRYRCDGVKDCPNGDDEASYFCGPDPCSGKISCPDLDYRCIDPSLYCCDPETDSSCKILYSCCTAVIEYKRKALHHKHQKETELVYLHSTVYTVIACAVAFVLLVLILSAIICRLQVLKSSRLIPRGAGRSHPPITLHDLDLYFNERRAQVDDSDHPNIGITYNINHGVQILGRDHHHRPPPYSAARNEGRHNEPPPPYISNENVANQEPLLNNNEDNNNGDINGNSEMLDNNVGVEAPVRRAPLAQRDVTPPLSHSTPPTSRPAFSTPPPPPSIRPAYSTPPPRYPGIDRNGYSDTSTDDE